MKYRIAGLAGCLVLLMTAAVVPFVSKDGEERYHQHLEAAPKAECSHGDDVFCTHLPLVVIDTDGAEIPGEPVYDEETWKQLGYTTTDDGSKVLSAQMEIMDSESTNNHLNDGPVVESGIQIRIRGNSSREFEKKNYAVRLVDESGMNAPQKIMGMDAHHEWVLHGPILDKTLIRNYMWYNISGEIMDYAPNVRFCEVVLNGEYQGLYVMMENITAGKDGARLNLSVSKKNNAFTGYLLRLDRGSSNELKNVNNFTTYTRRNLRTIDIVYPGSGNLTEELQRSITRDFSDFEKMLYSYDYDHMKYGYERYLDVSSFVDYFLINELTCNRDAGNFSTYIYKDMNGKYGMCVWDFNSACDNYQETAVDAKAFELYERLWYFMLIKDEDFTDKIISRYRQLRKTYFDEAYLEGYIDDVISYLGEAIDRNYKKWGYTFDSQYDMLIPEERNPHSYEEAVSDMKDFLRERIMWMDDNIETLRQYSAESRVKKFNENAN